MKTYYTEPVAVLELGSSSIRILVGQQSARGEWTILDKGENSLSLGRDVFAGKSITSSTAQKAIDILRGYKEVMATYGVKRYRAVGTSALREARNRDSFVDRVLINTGIDIQILSGVEANQMNYLAVMSALGEVLPPMKRNNVLILEVGGGSTELMLLQQGKMTASELVSIGSVRYLEQLADEPGLTLKAGAGFMSLHTHRLLGGLERTLNLKKVSCLIALGGDARLAATCLKSEEREGHKVISRDAFHKLMQKFRNLTVDEIVDELNVSYADAELFFPSLIIYDTFFEYTKVNEIIIPDVSIREGLLRGAVMEPEEVREVFRSQILAACRSVSKRYSANRPHFEFVRKIGITIYDHMLQQIGMEKRQRLLLEAASILHDIGSFISGRGHHKHGAYLVENAEIFGLNSRDQKIVAQVVRYHRKAKPQQGHEGYRLLDRKARLVVQKLSAILRIADALDRSHAQRIDIKDILFEGRNMIIITSFSGDMTLERFSLQEKGDLLEDLFGFQVSIRSQGIDFGEK